jgi:glyceraldehyde 3-phosphate dehydrogenase
MIRVAINGYGRIGRIAHRVILEHHASEIEVVAINAGSSTDLAGWMYLLKYDTVYGPLTGHKLSVKPVIASEAKPGTVLHLAKQSQEGEIAASPSAPRNDQTLLGNLVVDDKEIPVYSQKDPTMLPWKDLSVDVVIESTGHFRKKEELEKHIQAGAKAVVLSAPEKGGEIGTYVLSINEKDYKGENIISNASCTTNCITPVAKIINDYFGIEKAMMTTIHGYTSDQRLQDGGHKDYRRARNAAENIIPTSTGATTAAAKALPALKDTFAGLSLRVPVPVGSLADFTFLLKKQVTAEEINEAFTQEAGNESYKGIIEVTTDPIVSSDIIGNPHSSIIDLSLTQVVGGNMAKVIAWYDNEYGYANRLVEETVMVGKR